jgi:TusA-related sulfurtransferase
MGTDKNRSLDDVPPAESLLEMTPNTLDLRKTKCPLNFVKAKLRLEKLAVGAQLTIWVLMDAESALNIPESLRQEGHTVELLDVLEGVQPLLVTRGPTP